MAGQENDTFDRVVDSCDFCGVRILGVHVLTFLLIDAMDAT